MGEEIARPVDDPDLDIQPFFQRHDGESGQDGIYGLLGHQGDSESGGDVVLDNLKAAQFEYDLQDGDWVTVQASPHSSYFVRFQDRAYFYRTLMDRLV